jgi:hypothetical protein
MLKKKLASVLRLNKMKAKDIHYALFQKRNAVSQECSCCCILWYIWMMSCVKRPSLLKPLLNFASCRLQDVARTRWSHSALCYNSAIKSCLKPIFFFKQVFFFMNQFSCLSSYSVARRMRPVSGVFFPLATTARKRIHATNTYIL